MLNRLRPFCVRARRPLPRWLTSLYFAGMAAMGIQAHAADTGGAITFTAYAYPPKLVLDGNRAYGAHADAIGDIAKQAGLELEWLPTNINEETRMLDDGRRAFCTTGRIYTAERAKRWTFLPFRFDQLSGDIVVTRPELLDKLRQEGNVNRLAANPAYTGALIQGTHYGEVIDDLLTQKPAWFELSGKTDRQLVQLVAGGRAHYAIVIEDDWTAMGGAATGLVAVLDFGTLPGGWVHLACSRAVPPATIARLSASMNVLGYTPAQFTP